MRIIVDVSELVALPARIERISRESARDLAIKLARSVSRQHDERFDRQQDPDGSPWRPRKDRKPHPILQETGALRRSVVVTARTEEIEVSASEPYARFHQDGTTFLPKRRFLGFGVGDLLDLADESETRMARYIGGRL